MKDLRVKIFSITDHDTMWAYRGFIKSDDNLLMLPLWIEITTHYKWRTLHVLAYGLDPNSQDVNSFQERQRKSRRERAMKITELLNHDLIRDRFAPIPLEKILWLEIEWPITRPDIANYLVSIGYVSTFKEAFDRWLGKYDIPLESWAISDVLSMINDNKWRAILAHPFAPHVSLNTISPDIEIQIWLLQGFQKLGLHGVEWFYSDMSKDTNGKIIEQLHQDYKFLITGWSDFHGGNKTSVLLPGVSMPKKYVFEFIDTF